MPRSRRHRVEHAWHRGGVQRAGRAGSRSTRPPFARCSRRCLIALGDSLTGSADVALTVRSRDSEVIVSLCPATRHATGDCGRVSLYRELRGMTCRRSRVRMAWTLSRCGAHAMLRFPMRAA